ncbi:Mating-type protein beta1-1 [Hypsizygus marmoreus]|uniref:Mating-type protein HD1.2 n=1 Tax=Hypsizygus marmoreus TaxID=39966 RepID=A0A369K593_HYPMA|nr:mating-type protein HD1.2 [Hypsizygus marmoreus]RDB29068.1 Mating-type protein beta1-1 [Hypsizygus marmoreus]
MADSIHDRLSCVETNFMQAVARGGSALDSFGNLWAALLQDIEIAVQNQTLSKETMSFANSVASRILLLNSFMTDFQEHADSMHSDLEDTFARVDISATLAGAQSTSHDTRERSPSSSLDDRCDQSNPSYIEPAYRWLLQNLHNPYPSTETRETIARDTGAARKGVDAWFVEARKRMGWNALRKARFANKRVDIVDAATRFFVKPDDKRPLDSNIELEFASVEKRANDLYAEKFSESTLATKLDVAVKDLTPEMKARARTEERRRRQAANEALAASSYPSPERSPGRTPEAVASPFSEDHDLATVYPEAISGRKRRGSSSSPDEQDDDTGDHRPQKRSRLDEPPSNTNILSTGLPSPTPSTHDSLQTPSPASIRSESLPIPLVSSRKRRLSESDGPGAPKRPRNLPVGPRMHAVSDPLPLSSALFEASRFDNWFSNNFGIPDAVHADELDPSQPLDIEFFQYSTLNSQTHGIPLEPSITEQRYSPQLIDEPFPSLIVDDALLSADALEISTNTFDYNELFWDLEEPQTQFSGQNLVNQPQDSLLMSQTSLDYHPAEVTFFPPTSISPQAFNPSAVTFPSQSFPEVPASNFDWLFQPLVPSPQDMFGPTDKLQDFGQNIAGQDPFQVFSPLDPTGDSLSQLLLQADKAAKQRKLEEMKEATRRLEEEIAAS